MRVAQPDVVWGDGCYLVGQLSSDDLGKSFHETGLLISSVLLGPSARETL